MNPRNTAERCEGWKAPGRSSLKTTPERRGYSADLCCGRKEERGALIDVIRSANQGGTAEGPERLFVLGNTTVS
jgi:hypothetical protein